jgi:hypothetical protein
MTQLTQIDCDVLELLDEANVMVLLRQDGPIVDDLIKRLRHGAHLQNSTGHADKAELLERAAEKLDQRQAI